ncbi:MAG: hypothetical protein USCAAHI_00237 [Beijerinckiaceae bacterium]|nr:MAG: hypothetical protein USCAAHI_00237 [Beijerinckiaceae bacterium]
MFITIGLLWQAFRNAVDGIISGPKPSRLRPIEDCADPLPDPSRRLRLYEPNRRENLEDIRGFYFIDRLVSENGKHILGKRVDPLCAVLEIFPGRQVLGVNGSRRLLKGWNDHSLFAALCQRIAALPSDLTEGEPCLPRFSQGHELAAA